MSEEAGRYGDEQIQEQSAENDAPEDLTGLKSALQKERMARRELERQVKHFGDINPEEYRKLQQQSQMMAEWERRRAEEIGNIKNTYEAQLQRVQQQHEQMSQALVETEMTYALTEAFYQAGGKRDPNLAKLLAPQLLGRVNYDEQGNLIAVDPSGSPRLRDDGKQMGVADLMQEIKASSYGVLFDAVDPVGGSGASGSQMSVSTGRKLLKTSDPRKLGQNIEGIAKGEIVVDLG